MWGKPRQRFPYRLAIVNPHAGERATMSDDATTAHQILLLWDWNRGLGKGQAAWLEGRKRPGETALQACNRLAAQALPSAGGVSAAAEASDPAKPTALRPAASVRPGNRKRKSGKVRQWLQHFLGDPPFRRIVRPLVKRLSRDVRQQALWDVSDRPNYLQGVLAAADQARLEGISEIAVIEFGVAGGNGLVALQWCAERVEEETGVRIVVFG